MFDNLTRHIQVVTDDAGPSILKSEVLRALRSAKSGKTSGPDNVPIEILNLLEGQLDMLTQFFNNIYETGILPDDWLLSKMPANVQSTV